jgi:hypothetical protein
LIEGELRGNPKPGWLEKIGKGVGGRMGYDRRASGGWEEREIQSISVGLWGGGEINGGGGDGREGREKD